MVDFHQIWTPFERLGGGSFFAFFGDGIWLSGRKFVVAFFYFSSDFFADFQ